MQHIENDAHLAPGRPLMDGPRPHHALPARPAAAALALLLAASCGGGGGGDAPVGGGPAGDSVTQSLNALGVDTTETPRTDEQGGALPADYSPFGASFAVDPTVELFFGGLGLEGGTAVGSVIQDLNGNDPDSNGWVQPELLSGMSAGAAPFLQEQLGSEAAPQSLRAAAGADVDGDGWEELFTAYVDGLEVRLHRVEDAQQGYAVSDTLIANEADIVDVALVGGDFDGDGRDELALTLSRDVETLLLFVAEGPGGLEIDPAATQVLPQSLTVSRTTVELAAGNLDHDKAEELALVVNELRGGCDSIGRARYFVFDDALAGYAGLASGLVQADDQDGVQRTAVVADVALGDVDGDHRDEVLLAGLTDISTCGGCQSAKYLMVALEDAVSGVAVRSAHFRQYFYSNCPAFAAWHLRFAHVNAFDLDDDGRDEVHVNNLVFQDFAEAADWTEAEDWTLPQVEVFEQNDIGWFDSSTSAYVVGDFTADGREDLVLYRQDRPEIRVYGIDQLAQPPAFTLVARIETAFDNGQYPKNPLLVPLNVDQDSAVLRYDAGQHELIYTEPIVLVALAAPPCKPGIDQNLDACQTTFGNSTSSGTAGELSITISASSKSGIDVDGPLPSTGVEMTSKITASATAFAGFSYETTKTILYTAGAGEDAVIFTTVPMDQYVYTLLSHPEPELVGKTVTVQIPREPVVLLAERGYFNSHVIDGAVRIDQSVFTHMIGDPTSYPSRFQKDARVNGGGGLDVGPVFVGQGGGQTEVVLEVGQEYNVGGTLSLGYEFEASATVGGVVKGYSVGASVAATLQVTSGSATTYQGVVGNIGAEYHATEAYGYGLYTYVHTDPVTGRQFEVVNYWVE